MTKLILLTLGLAAAAAGGSQEIPVKTEQQLENLGEARGEELGEEWFQHLQQYLRAPLNLNLAGRAELEALQLLSPLQVEALIVYRANVGRLVDLYELQAIPGWDLATINRLLPFVAVAGNRGLVKDLPKSWQEGQQQLQAIFITNLEKARGYDRSEPNHFLGDPFRLLLRYRYRLAQKLQWGVLLEKDAGESIARGPDFVSGYLFWQGRGALRALALGDYRLNLGQGLLLWQSLAFGKGVDVLGIKRQAPLLEPYRSAAETGFCRGLAASFGWKAWSATGFFSYRQADAVLRDSGRSFSAFIESGLHRTAGELRSKNSVSHLLYGAVLQYDKDRIRAGLHLLTHRFSHNLNPPAAPYSRFAFRGSGLSLASASFSYRHPLAHLFGEIASDASLHTGLCLGALFALTGNAELALHYRRLSAAFPGLFGNAFTEASLPQNEEGVYAAFAFRPQKGLQLGGFADLFSFPWLRFQADAPAGGAEFGLQLDLAPRKALQLQLSYRDRTKEENTAGLATDYTVAAVRRSVRLQAQLSPAPAWNLRFRSEMVWWKQGERQEEGYLGQMEANGRWGRWKGNLRLQYFETDGYITRIYALERDLGSALRAVALYGRGFRYALSIDYQCGRSFLVSGRWVQSLQPGKNSTGSGLDMISGSSLTTYGIGLTWNRGAGL